VGRRKKVSAPALRELVAAGPSKRAARAAKAAPPPQQARPLDSFEPVGASGAPGAPAPYSADVSQVSPAELLALEAGTPQQKRLAITIERARDAYAGLLTGGAKVVVSTPAGNGGEPVLTLVPKGFDASQPFRVQTHYHGWNSSVAEPKAHAAGVTASIEDSFAKDAQTVFVLPECKNVPTNAKPAWAGHQNVNVQTDWSNVSDIAATTTAALTAAGVDAAPAERVLSAHSGGGRALGYAEAAHPDGSGLVADRIELYDCLYAAPAGTLSARAALEQWFATPSGAAAKHVTYFEGDGGNGEKPDAAFTRALGPRYEYHGHYTHNGTVAQNLGKAKPPLGPAVVS
jgi:hypothetical protein